jgi:hypothetical protein
VTKFWRVYLVESRLKSATCQKPPQATATRAQVLQRTKGLGLDFLDHDGALWMFCPVAKVFDSGDARHHALFHEYGKNRSKFMWKALEKAHPAQNGFALGQPLLDKRLVAKGLPAMPALSGY